MAGTAALGGLVLVWVCLKDGTGMERGSPGRGPGPWRAVQPKGQHWAGEGRKVLPDWQDCGFGSVPIAFPLWEKHTSDRPLPLQHGCFPPMLPLPPSPASLVTGAYAEPQPCPKPGCGCVWVG